MPGKRKKNIDLVQHVTKTPRGGYKYQRRVPHDLQETLGRAMWDFSLGSDPTDAARRGLELAAQHDHAIQTLTTQTTKATATEWVETLRVFERLLTETKGAQIEDAWEKTRAYMRDAREHSPQTEADRLKILAAMVFGERVSPLSNPFATPPLAFDTPPPPLLPEDPTDRALYDATKGMVLDRLNTLEKQSPPEAEGDDMRLLAMMGRYAKPLSPSSQRAYMQKARRMADRHGNKLLPAYTFKEIKDHRDHLADEGVSPASVAQHLNNLKTLWRWAAAEYPDELPGLAFPAVDPPKVKKMVEETRWQAFDDKQIKKIWSLLNVTWGPESSSKLSPSRRQAFLMAVRTMLYTGMRPNEVFRLTAANVQDDILTITHTKTRQGRKIPITKHLEDLPAFLTAGGFAAEMAGDDPTSPTKPESLAGTLRDNFRAVIRDGGISGDKLVLYSLKDTLVDRLQRQGAADDTIRGIIGHVTGQKSLRNYKTPFGQSAHGLETMRKALDSIAYW